VAVDIREETMSGDNSDSLAPPNTYVFDGERARAASGSRSR